MISPWAIAALFEQKTKLTLGIWQYGLGGHHYPQGYILNSVTTLVEVPFLMFLFVTGAADILIAGYLPNVAWYLPCHLLAWYVHTFIDLPVTWGWLSEEAGKISNVNHDDILNDCKWYLDIHTN